MVFLGSLNRFKRLSYRSKVKQKKIVLQQGGGTHTIIERNSIHVCCPTCKVSKDQETFQRLYDENIIIQLI